MRLKAQRERHVAALAGPPRLPVRDPGRAFQRGASMLLGATGSRLLKVEILRHVEQEMQRQHPVRSGWEQWFYCELADQIDLRDRVYSVIAADEPHGYQIRVPIFQAWFHTRARDRYPEIVSLLRDDLIRAAKSSDTRNSVPGDTKI